MSPPNAHAQRLCANCPTFAVGCVLAALIAGLLALASGAHASTLVAARSQPATPFSRELVKIDDITGAQTSLGSPGGAPWALALSPDGQTVALNGVSNLGLMTVGIDGSNLQTLVPEQLWGNPPHTFGATPSGASFHPDGAHLAFGFENGSTDNQDLYTVGLDGTGSLTAAGLARVPGTPRLLLGRLEVAV